MKKLREIKPRDKKQDAKLFARGTNNDFFEKMQTNVNDLFFKSLLVKRGKYSLIDIQVELFAYLLIADLARRKYARGKERFGRLLARMSDANSPKDKLIRVQNRVDDMDIFIAGTDFVVKQLHKIGDGIAWWYLEYDRATLRLLAEHQDIPVPEWNKGSLEEINRLEQLARNESSAILNSTTNFLRTGDIITHNKKNNELKIIEVKAGSVQTARTVRQKEYLTLVQEGIDKGVHNLAGKSIKTIWCESPLLTYIGSLDNAIDEAKEKLISSRKFGDYLSFGVLFQKMIVEKIPEDDHFKFQDKIITRILSIIKSSDDLLLPIMDSLFFLLHFSPNIAPYTIFPVKPPNRLSILSGDIMIMSSINVSGLGRWLTKRGWKVKIVKLPEKMDYINNTHIPVIQVYKGAKGVELGLDSLVVAAVELWMPESIERVIATMLENKQTIGSDYMYTVNFPNKGQNAWD